MCVSVFGKRLSRKSNNVVVFPFAFHIAVQQLFKPLWSRLLLYDLEPSQASFALRFKLMTLLPASEEFLSKFLSSRYLSSSGSYPLDLSGVGDPAGTADLALRVTGTHKPLHRDKVVIPSGGGGGELYNTKFKIKKVCNEVCVSFNSNHAMQHSNYNKNKLVQKEQLR
jgi:hypothetical protein